MNSNTVNADEEFKSFCASIGCNKQADRQLAVKFVHKRGWFCKDCADEFLRSGLVEEEDVI